MIVKHIEEITIFESPDGGKTVYKRSSGDSRRTLVSESTEAKVTSRWANFKEIIEAAETNESLDIILKQAEVTYELIKDRE